jgi:uncharacterized membrane protein HdeD (DUF308 family)
MKGLTRIGKMNVAFGLVFIIIGLLLLVPNLDHGLVLKENQLTIAFLCLGMALICSAMYLKSEH